MSYGMRHMTAQRSNVRIDRGGGGVIRKAEPVPGVTTPFVEDTLVAPIPRALRFEKLCKLLKLFLPWCKHQDTGVEYVRPADVGNGGKLVGYREQVRHRPYGEDVRIQED